MNSDIVTLEAPTGPYFSQHDEDVFFAWLKIIRSVVRVEGELRTLYIDVDVVRCGPTDFRELLALFTRYGVDMRQLATIERAHNVDWLKNSSEWWHPILFPGIVPGTP